MTQNDTNNGRTEGQGWEMLTPRASGTPYKCVECGNVETVSIYSGGYRDEPDSCPECSGESDTNSSD